MEETLDSVATSLIEESDAQTVDSSTENAENTQNTAPKDTDPNQAQDDGSPTDSQKLSRYKSLEKRFNDNRAHWDRKGNEYVSKIQQLENRLKSYAPLEPFLPDLQKILAEKQQREAQEKFQANPTQANQQMLDQMLQERLGPMQQQFQEAQFNQAATGAINHLKTTYGEEAFSEAAPIMSEYMNNVKQKYGQEVSDILVKEPDFLFDAAFGRVLRTKIQEYNNTKAQGMQNKQQMARVAAGVSRPNRTTRVESNGSSQEDIEKSAFNFLEGK